MTDEWPEGVSSGLTLPCADCGQVPQFDYHVYDDFWKQHVQGEERLGVICLPCLDIRCGGVGLAEALQEVQWIGAGYTVVCVSTFYHVYNTGEKDDRDGI